jgi:NAD(P)-dependent dehydrogenase (short-subunit alcohol dehydrogenase family)
MDNMGSLSNKVAVVTGASKGIGGATATAFGAAGARVADVSKAADVARLFQRRGTLHSEGWTFWSTTPGLEGASGADLVKSTKAQHEPMAQKGQVA